MTSDGRRICLGAFAGAHGVRGDLRVKTFTQIPQNAGDYGPVETEDGAQRFTLKFVRGAKGDIAIFRAKEVTSREAAEALKGQRFYVDRDALPATEQDEFYIEDLVGLIAKDETGAPMGRVGAVHNFGAGDILELRDIPDVKGVRLIAFTEENVPALDLASGEITVAAAALDEGDEPPSSRT